MLLPAATAERSSGRPAATLLVVIVTAAMMALAMGLAPAAAGKAEAAGQLKAVVIVGPSGSLQSSNNAAGKAIADVAASYGMDVRRIFHPYATWSKVLANIQGASIVVYLGHGNGWPSPYRLTRRTPRTAWGSTPRRAARPSSTGVRRRSPSPSTWRRTPSCCSTTSATRAATASPAGLPPASRRPSSGWTTTPMASSAPAPGPSSPTAIRTSRRSSAR